MISKDRKVVELEAAKNNLVAMCTLETNMCGNKIRVKQVKNYSLTNQHGMQVE